MPGKTTTQREMPVAGGACPYQTFYRDGLPRASEGVVVPRKPGKPGGGKDPWFWSAFDGGKGQGDWREPTNPRSDPGPPEEAVRQGQGGADVSVLQPLRQDLADGHPHPRVPPGESQAWGAWGDRHAVSNSAHLPAGRTSNTGPAVR
jgi:hypothetical protein